MNKAWDGLEFTEHDSVILPASDGKKYDIPLKFHYTHVMPKSCADCPVGYMQFQCGRNIPFEESDYKTRPDTCKLRLLDDNIDKLLLMGIAKEC